MSNVDKDIQILLDKMKGLDRLTESKRIRNKLLVESFDRKELDDLFCKFECGELTLDQFRNEINSLAGEEPQGERDLDEAGPDKSSIPAVQRKAQGSEWKTTLGDLEQEKETRISGPEGLKKLSKELDGEQPDSEVMEWMERFNRLG